MKEFTPTISFNNEKQVWTIIDKNNNIDIEHQYLVDGLILLSKVIIANNRRFSSFVKLKQKLSKNSFLKILLIVNICIIYILLISKFF